MPQYGWDPAWVTVLSTWPALGKARARRLQSTVARARRLQSTVEFTVVDEQAPLLSQPISCVLRSAKRRASREAQRRFELAGICRLLCN